MFSVQYLRKQTRWVQIWMLFFGPLTHIRFKPEIIDLIPSKVLAWIFFLFFDPPTFFRFKPEMISKRALEGLTKIYFHPYLRKPTGSVYISQPSTSSAARGSRSILSTNDIEQRGVESKEVLRAKRCWEQRGVVQPITSSEARGLKFWSTNNLEQSERLNLS